MSLVLSRQPTSREAIDEQRASQRVEVHSHRRDVVRISSASCQPSIVWFYNCSPRRSRFVASPHSAHSSICPFWGRNNLLLQSGFHCVRCSEETSHEFPGQRCQRFFRHWPLVFDDRRSFNDYCNILRRGQEGGELTRVNVKGRIAD